MSHPFPSILGSYLVARQMLVVTHRLSQPQLIPTKYFNCVQFTFTYWFACVYPCAPVLVHICLHLYHTLELDKSAGIKYHGNYQIQELVWLVPSTSSHRPWLTTLQFLVGPPDLIKQFKYVRLICHCIVMSIKLYFWHLEDINIKYNTLC